MAAFLSVHLRSTSISCLCQVDQSRLLCSRSSSGCSLTDDAFFSEKNVSLQKVPVYCFASWLTHPIACDLNQ